MLCVVYGRILCRMENGGGGSVAREQCRMCVCPRVDVLSFCTLCVCSLVESNRNASRKEKENKIPKKSNETFLVFLILTLDTFALVIAIYFLVCVACCSLLYSYITNSFVTRTWRWRWFVFVRPSGRRRRAARALGNGLFCNATRRAARCY